MSGTEKKSILLIVASLASFLVTYTVSSLTATLSEISGSSRLDAVTLGWFTSAYLLTAAK